MADPFEYLGAGIVLPFRRDGKQDFANSSGLEMIRSSLRLILGTMCAGPENEGEIRFNQRLGTLIQTLRHRNIDDPATQEIAVHYVYEAIRDNEPRVIPLDFRVDKDADRNQMKLRLAYKVVDESGVDVGGSVFTDEVTV